MCTLTNAENIDHFASVSLSVLIFKRLQLTVEFSKQKDVRGYYEQNSRLCESIDARAKS